MAIDAIAASSDDLLVRSLAHKIVIDFSSGKPEEAGASIARMLFMCEYRGAIDSPHVDI
jgi:hypothetical protein